MNIKDFAANIQRLAKKYPDAIVVYSSDSEGNGFSEVDYGPTPGYFDPCSQQWDTEPVDGEGIRAICVN